MKSIEALKQRARQLKRDALALFYAYRDPRLPWYARAVLCGDCSTGLGAVVVCDFPRTVECLADARWLNQNIS